MIHYSVRPNLSFSFRANFEMNRRVFRFALANSTNSKNRKAFSRNASSYDIPYNKGIPVLGTSLAIGAAGGAPKLHEYVDNRHKEFGHVFRENMGSVSAVFVSNPSIIRKIFLVEGKYPRHFVPKAWTLYNELHNCKRGLFFMEGDEWYKWRKLMNKYFLSPSTLDDLKNVHEGIVEGFVKRWKKFDGREVSDMEFEFYRHSISFVLGSLIGDSYLRQADKYDNYVTELATKFQSVFETSSKLNILPSVKIVQFLRLPLWGKFESSVTSSLDASKKVVSMALEDLSKNGLLSKLSVNEGIPADMISALVADLLIAAGDTTAFTSQWAVYRLGRDANIQNSARQDSTLIRGAVRETLRLYPSAPFITRILPNDETIDGYKFNAEELVLLSLYTAGRNDELYPRADLFEPERWVKRNSGGYAGVTDVNGFLPFAMGSRSCIGARLANIQLQTTIRQVG
ncbi:unnamed protein product [Nesidiocoris tenuis]|uniref:Cytochrome P450 n=1 Tax=Nesidiocoris tenuis TaxID=355587 RepID=A0A6H5HEQ9_9HEMI|nr:unnamed protein product [Nesidiocoris tenuis]